MPPCVAEHGPLCSRSQMKHGQNHSQLDGCTEGLPEEVESMEVAEAFEAYEAKRLP
jgi:hypothetical protein